MPALDAAGAVELAVLERSGLIESRHLGAAVVLDPGGSVIAAHGDIDALVYPRSTLKPMQAVTMLALGAPLADERLVLATASHAGTPRHVAVVERMLADAGLSESDLGCPADLPLDRAAARDADEPRPVTMNCSGKHAGFLTAANHVGWPTAGYLEPDHPVQRAVRATVEALTGERITHIGVDGCGAPIPAISLRALARGTSRALTGDAPLAAAIRADPWALDGEGRANTVTIQSTGLIAKGGHEGVLVLGAESGVTLALKVLDGSARAATLVGLELMVRAGAVTRERADAALERCLPPVLGGGDPVGALRVSDAL